MQVAGGILDEAGGRGGGVINLFTARGIGKISGETGGGVREGSLKFWDSN